MLCPVQHVLLGKLIREIAALATEINFQVAILTHISFYIEDD